MPFYCGFDFGTSNTVVTLIGDGGSGQRVFSDSSVLFLPDCGPRAQKRYIGQRAIDEYMASGMNGRFVQSIKSVLPDPSFVQTNIYEKMYSPEELAAMIIRDFKNKIEDFLGTEINGAVFGRPVNFSTIGADDVLAETRLRAAAERCGFSRIEFLYEPVAAAARYTPELSADSVALVCDFGGGTADFSVIRLETGGTIRIPASHGVRIGGDDLDSEIMWHRLVGYFGHGTLYESYGKLLPVPIHIYRTIRRWDRIAFLKTMEYRDELTYIRNGAVDKAGISRLISLIDDDLCYALFQAIRAAKHELSEHDTAAVRFFEHGIELKERIRAEEFGEYIQDELLGIDAAVSETLLKAGINENQINMVFLTGGSSMVRQIRDQAEKRFPSADIRMDTDRFNSVSLGLAMEARKRNLTSYQSMGK
ncbi:MAG: Hsp70 family protein [Spirochaetales bacterium]|nr:Hsp70 family protein [Spirochaetales bacterium]